MKNLTRIVFWSLGAMIAIMAGYSLAHCECPENEVNLIFDWGRSYQVGVDYAVHGLGNQCQLLLDSEEQTFTSEYSPKIRAFFVAQCEKGFLEASKKAKPKKMFRGYDNNPKFNF